MGHFGNSYNHQIFIAPMGWGLIWLCSRIFKGTVTDYGIVEKCSTFYSNLITFQTAEEAGEEATEEAATEAAA